MKTGRRGISFLLGLLLGVLALLPAVSPAMAGSSYQVIKAPVVKDNAVYELGIIFARFTAGQLQQNDVVTFRLPSDFIWTTAGLKADEAAADAAAQTTGQWNDVTATDNYMRYGTVNYVEVPQKYSGNDNGLFQSSDPVLSFTSLSDNEVRMEVTGNPEPGQECFFYLYAKRVYVPGGYNGEISVLFDAPSNSGFFSGEAFPGRVSGAEAPKVEETPAPAETPPVEPTPPPVLESKTVANFVIGEEKFELNGVEVDMDVAPYLKDGRTYLPVRYAVRALGVADTGIQWNGAEESVTINDGSRTLKLLIGSKVMYVDNAPVTMDAAPEIVSPGRTMLSLRWVAEALGAEVQWDAVKQAVTVEKKD